MVRFPSLLLPFSIYILLIFSSSDRLLLCVPYVCHRCAANARESMLFRIFWNPNCTRVADVLMFSSTFLICRYSLSRNFFLINWITISRQVLRNTRHQGGVQHFFDNYSLIRLDNTHQKFVALAYQRFDKFQNFYFSPRSLTEQLQGDYAI